jgi:hypothetical protein
MAVVKENYLVFVIREAITRAGSGCFQTELLLVHGDSHSRHEGVLCGSAFRGHESRFRTLPTTAAT